MLRRISTLAFAAFQFMLAGALPLADSQLAERANILVAGSGHVESEGRRDCPRLHTDACVLCQHIAARPLPQPRSSILVAARIVRSAPESARSHHASHLGLERPSSRAPPSQA